jgi:predicted amidophosphoribosyltransferase
MQDRHPRMVREQKTVEAMIALYCRGQHGSQHGLCEACAALQEYTRQRLHKCPYQEGKTTCARCPLHCYRPEMREKIRAVMRYSGPRMLVRHPVMALRHMLDRLRQEPVTLPQRTAG